MNHDERHPIIVLIVLITAVVASNLLLSPGSTQDLLQLTAAPAAELTALLLAKTRRAVQPPHDAPWKRWRCPWRRG